MSGPALTRLTADAKAPTVTASAILDHAYAESPHRIDVTVVGGRVWVPFEGTAVYVYP